MTQWFRGQLEGHYVGTHSGKPAVSQFGDAQRYQLRIYRGLIRDIEVFDSVPPEEPDPVAEGEELETRQSLIPELPVDLPQGCFYQAKIEDTRLLGLRPRTCFEGTVYDVSVDKLHVTHSTKKGNKTYGRLVGEVYGRYLLPPEADPEEEVQVAEELVAVHESHVAGEEEALQALKAKAETGDDSGLEALHPPTAPSEDDSREPANIPIPLLVVLMAIVLGLSSGATSALLWLGLLTPILITRLMLSGQFQVDDGQRVVGAILVLLHLGCLGLLLLDWWTSGCFAANLWPIWGIGITVLVTGVMPSPFPLVCTGGGLALILFLLYGKVATTCESESSPATPAVEAPAEAPTVGSPGMRRTNDDGSWPRRREK